GYNLTDMILKRDGKLIIHPLVFEFKFKIENKYKLPFNRMLGIKLWGCNWDCRWCPTKFYPPEDLAPIRESVDQITDRLLNLDHDARTIFAITGGEPLLQKEGVLKWIESLKRKPIIRLCS
ncbi:MAG: radical SAM protein, partial [Euryarchaeota archaeon]|nr:radical SAM protein [Euryarchaeota archaeon]